ncbi:hypothetical protein CECT5772_09497 [Streptococcus equi subsp. ruminatorum CECT 5772]|uniref:Uncharacterized protein n=1 Tax=Streptococcus equi subsp. ruminatorum CECT 5772 TaxID=1051981 RepID=A0A922NT09_9STRE|nr:hypothetical protein CECT5772_09497 [Streptococcus equi subsp. ruminatorum CECT 5772]
MTENALSIWQYLPAAGVMAGSLKKISRKADFILLKKE